MIKRFIEWVRKESFWDLMAWASLAMIFFWALAKSFGWINTPALIEMIPLFGAVFLGGKFLQRFETFEKRLSRVETNTLDVKEETNEMAKNLIKINERLKRVDEKLHDTDLRLLRMESKID